MSKPVAYSVVIRNGRQRCFEDIWVSLYRELLWGPEAFETWLSHGEEVDWDPEELSGVAFVNFDLKELRWGEREVLNQPRSHAVHRRLLEHAWPGFKITFLTEAEMYSEVAGPSEDDDDDDDDNDDDSWNHRPETVNEAAEYFDDDDEEEDDDDPYDDDMPRAWVTIADEDGRIRQRNLSMLSADLMSGSESAVQDLIKQKSAEVPPEKAVTEGLWIHIPDKQIRLWGGANTRRDLPRLQQAWPDWDVAWADNGYVEQCGVSGVSGVVMTEAEALAQFMPHVLSAQKMDVSTVMGAVGGELKKTAMKATGCLWFVLAIPILLTGFFMDKLKESGYAIAALAVVFAIIFKIMEYRLKSKFREGPLQQQSDETGDRPPVAGPLDEKTRREGVDRMLQACGFLPLTELEQHFPDDSPLAGLM